MYLGRDSVVENLPNKCMNGIMKNATRIVGVYRRTLPQSYLLRLKSE
jgi:hypothetical protein